MKLKLLLVFVILLISLSSCGAKNENKSIASYSCVEPSTIVVNDSSYELKDFSNEIKKEQVINPGMGFYRTRYLTLKRETSDVEYDFEEDGFYHVRIDISNFSKANNKKDDYDITDSALLALDNYFKEAKKYNCSLIIRFAYDGFLGKSNLEPSISKMKDHIASLSSIINNYTDLIIAIECGLIGPWGEMHTSTLDVQSTYNELFPAWLSNVNDLPILSRKPRYVYKYMGYTLDNLDTFVEASGNDKRLGVFNDGYYGSDLDTGTYETIEARYKETIFISKLNNILGGECIGEPTKLFTYEEIINEMNLINLTYLNYEWDDSIVASWKNIEFDNSTFYNYMVNHMGFKLYVNNVEIESIDDGLKIKLGLGNMGFSNITRKLKLIIKINNGTETQYITKDINDDSLSFEFNLNNINNPKLYLILEDNLGRKYELMNGSYENGINYIGEISEII